MPGVCVIEYLGVIDTELAVLACVAIYVVAVPEVGLFPPIEHHQQT